MSMPRSPQLNESGHNDFGREVPPLKDILADQTLSRVLQPMLHGILSRINVPKDMRRDLMDQVLRIIEIGQRLEHVEGNAHELMLGYGVVRGIQEALQDRAQCIMRQIKDSLVEGPTLDLGSGDGEVSNLLRQNGVVNEVTLADVYKHDAIDELDMPFELIDQGEQLPFRDGQFANVLALTAFHHMDRPASMIKEVSRVLAPGGRLVAIESVFDVPFIDIPPDDLTKPGGKLYSRLNASR
ncbi:class I SAM-dependent methyltransferase, partial [Candidatus Gracilibacteria bacterium]|nr:class I SAM-dependent methyltransferase [Candidatus Gracilibacteria bacterium]